MTLILPPSLRLGTTTSVIDSFVPLSERWHENTSCFHLSVEEMTIMLDDVACLLDITSLGGSLRRRS